MNFIKWLVTSSADPARYSKTVVGALTLGAAWLVQLSGLICPAIVCLEPTTLDSVVQTIGNIVYLALSLVGAVQFLWGLGRKIWLNRFSSYQVAPADLPTA